MLSRKGSLYLAHKNVHKFSSPESDWGADWKFIQRNVNEVEEIIFNSVKKNSFTINVSGDSSHIFFIELRKNKKSLT